jgi:hypothetical protein
MRITPKQDCPLPLVLLALLQACWGEGIANTKGIACALSCSLHTVHAEESSFWYREEF